jgi:lauroyl/myristoyl acyltransferase
MPSLQQCALLALLRGAAVATRLVPRRAAEPVCRVAGAVWYAGAPRARQAVRANLRQILGREPSTRQVRAVFMHGALNYWDTLALPQLRPQQVLALVDVEGWDHLDTALASGKGAILAGAHLSSVALAGQTVAARGYRVVGVVEAMRPPVLFDFLNELRQVLGVRLYPLGPAAARELLAALRRNEVVGLVTDRDVLGTGPVVQFFGAPTTFPDGPATLSIRTGAPVLPAVAVRCPHGTFRAWIEPPLPVPRTGNPKDDVRALTQAIARRLEYHIGVHPEQWTVFQRRWPDIVVKDSGA